MLQRAALMHTYARSFGNQWRHLPFVRFRHLETLAAGLAFEGRPFTLMDPEDVNHALKRIKEQLNLGKKDSSFPKSETIASPWARPATRNCPLTRSCSTAPGIFLPHAGALEEMAFAYRCFRRQNALLDYDDLLFELLRRCSK